MAEGKVLLIEDNPSILALVVDLLEIIGLKVITAVTAEDGIELARSESPDLILMDIGLPGMDGLTATRIIKEDTKINKIPVVAMSSHAMKGDKDKAIEAGCMGYITKPLDTKEFMKYVEKIISEVKRKEI
jgi:CheY-like chemotaxis protein